MRENLRANDADIYSTSVSGSGGDGNGSNIARNFAEAVSAGEDEVYSEPEKLVLPKRPDRSDSKPKSSWLGGTKTGDGDKKTSPEPLPRSWKEQDQIREEKERAEKEARKQAEEAARQAAEADDNSDERENDFVSDDGSGSEPDVVSREEYERLEHRVATLTHDYEALKARQKAALEEQVANANMNLVKTLIPIFDDFDKAIDYSQQNGLDTMDLGGVIKIRKKLSGALDADGLVAIDPLGEPFDMNEHQAIERDKTDGPEDIVTKVYQLGYKMNGRVIRPALVAVSYN